MAVMAKAPASTVVAGINVTYWVIIMHCSK